MRIGSLGLLGGILVITLLASGVRYGGRNATPPLAASCTTPGLAISTPTLVRGQPLYFAVAGPDGSVVLAIDAAQLRPDLTVTPLPGATDTQVDRERIPVKGCKGKGALGVQVAPGSHTISVFPATGGAALVSKPLTVTAR